MQKAIENGQRAISQAQLTKSGHVYVISNIGSFGEDVYKIGMTRRLEPLDRIRELGDASVPFSFDVHAMIYSNNAPELERELHKLFADKQINRVNPRKEFFKVPLLEIKEQAEKLGYEVEFTMLAEAKEYLESLSLEKEGKFTSLSESQYEDIDEMIESI
ncbi:GIY-YIG nuclease family protein [Glaesserella parasuis]|uniref:GIY-YIG nuclease family protein n=1 Tax=Glaesserella parasuis TaxID=738 RepID=UPI001F40C76A|nr:GIY-YIG nuclease family protein [Glaesserella parasuis]MDP0172007.1 GIY-YIG nuclease family protein [Glaesserella parasuis]